MKVKKLIYLIAPLLLISCGTGGTSSESSSTNNSESTSTYVSEDTPINSDDKNSEITNSEESVSSNLSSSLTSSVKSEENFVSSSTKQPELSEEKFSQVVSSINSNVNIVSKKTLYVSPNGNDSNSGDESSPLKTLAKAVSSASAGTTIYLEDGTYPCSERINLTASGTESEPITITARNIGKVELDFTEQPYGFNNSSYVGIYLKGNYWNIIGLTIAHAGDNGIKVEGSHNYIGRCVTHHCGDTGIQLGFGHNDDNPNGELCAYNTIENCDSYLNYDFDNHGDADGFACKMHNGKENYFIGCRAWRNCDDAWDLYETDWSVYIINCWAWESGNKSDFSTDKFFTDANYLSKKSGVKSVSKPTSAGNGNGIKLGGNGTGGNSKGIHYVYNCISFGSDITGSVKGFDENSHKGGVVMKNCVAWDNGYNYMFEEGGSKTEFNSCISFYTGNGLNKPNRLVGECGSGSKFINNNFKYDGGDLVMNLTVTADDFESISEADALAPREADGRLPNNGFGRLKTSSDAYKNQMGIQFGDYAIKY